MTGPMQQGVMPVSGVTTTHRLACVLLAGALLPGGCGRSSKPAASASSTTDFADASANGDKLSAAAIRKDAAFTCPASADSVGRAGPALNGRERNVSTTRAPNTPNRPDLPSERAH